MNAIDIAPAGETLETCAGVLQEVFGFDAFRGPQADIVTLERELSESLGSRVEVVPGRGKKGKLVIHYADFDVLDGVLDRLRTKP